MQGVSLDIEYGAPDIPVIRLIKSVWLAQTITPLKRIVIPLMLITLMIPDSVQRTRERTYSSQNKSRHLAIAGNDLDAFIQDLAGYQVQALLPADKR